MTSAERSTTFGPPALGLSRRDAGLMSETSYTGSFQTCEASSTSCNSVDAFRLYPSSASVHARLRYLMAGILVVFIASVGRYSTLCPVLRALLRLNLDEWVARAGPLRASRPLAESPAADVSAK
jgi:hypothetical protein